MFKMLQKSIFEMLNKLLLPKCNSVFVVTAATTTTTTTTTITTAAATTIQIHKSAPFIVILLSIPIHLRPLLLFLLFKFIDLGPSLLFTI